MTTKDGKPVEVSEKRECFVYELGANDTPVAAHAEEQA